MSDNEYVPKVWQADKPVKVEFLVQDHMVRKALENSRKFNIFHPSAWGSCLRKIAYQFYNEQEPFISKGPYDIDVRMERIFDNGHATHARWQKYLDEAGVLRGTWKCENPLCHREYGKTDLLGIKNPSRSQGWKCACGSTAVLQYEEILVQSAAEYNFCGHCDAVIDVRGTKFEQNGRYDIFVADLKTIKDEMYAELNAPKDEHVVQVNIYMWILNLQGAVVVYENKNSQALKEMFVPRDDGLIEKIKQQAIWMTNILKEKKLPFRPNGFSRSMFPCRMCEFVSHCYH